MPGSAPRHISVFPSPQELGSSLAQLVAQRAAEAGGRFSLGLSGGSLVRILAQELPSAAPPAGPAAPARWVLAFCDERLVPPEHPDSTFGAYKVPARRGGRAGGDPGPLQGNGLPGTGGQKLQVTRYK